SFPPSSVMTRSRPEREWSLCAAGFGSNGLSESRLDIAPVDIPRPEEAGRRPFQGPAFHLISILCIHDQFNVGISPVDFRERSAQHDAIIEIEYGRHVVVRPGRTSQQNDSNGNENNGPLPHRYAPC